MNPIQVVLVVVFGVFLLVLLLAAGAVLVVRYIDYRADRRLARENTGEAMELCEEAFNEWFQGDFPGPGHKGICAKHGRSEKLVAAINTGKYMRKTQ